MSTRKFAFIASLLSVVGLLAGSARAATYTTVTDLGGQTVSKTKVANTSDVFANDSGIKNGTLNLTFASGKWATFTGLSVLIQDATLNLIKFASDKNTSQSAELNIVNGSVVTIDGGKLTSDNNRTSNGNNIGNDNGVGTMRIINGGRFESPNIRVQIGSQTKSGGDATVGILSVDKGTVKIGGDSANQQLTVGGNRTSPEGVATGIVTMTNGVLSAYSIMLGDGIDGHTAQLTFKDSDLTVRTIYRSKKITEASYFIFDGTTVNTAAASQNILADLGFAYQLDGNGVTINAKHSGTTVGGAFVGNGPFIKKGAETLTFKGKFTDSADLRVEEGTLAFSGATLPDAGEIDLTISGTGAFEGLDQTESYKSLTLGEDAVLPVVFTDSAVTTFKAADTIVTATADHPVTIAGTGTLTVNTVIAEGLTVTDASLFVLSGVAGSLKIEDGKLIAVKPSRPVDTLTWAKGSAGDNWSGTDNWTYGDPASATTFQEGDTAVFATAGDKAVVDADVTAAKVEFTADATVTGTGTATLTTTNITVGADVTATIAVPLGEDIEKTGEGELVLQDYAAGKALYLKEGKVALAWNDAAKEDPISTEEGANTIAGVLDFGGAKQTLAGGVQKDTGIFRNGGEVRNGEILVDPSDWLALIGVTDFTIGEGASVSFKKYGTNTAPTRNRGQLNLQNSYLRISGKDAKFAVMNERETQKDTPYNSYGRIGSTDGDATVEIIAGGMFSHEKRCLILGFETNQGAIVGAGGTVTLGSQDLYLSYSKGAAMLALTNSTLTAKYVNLGWSKQTPGKQTIEFVGGTMVKVAGFKKNAVHAESYILFDDATLVPTAAGDLLPNLGVPTTIGANGLIISNDYDVAVAAPLTGEGKLTKKGTGMLTFSGAQSFEGGLEVCAGSIGSTLTADGFTTQNLDLSLNLADGETVRLTIAGTPEPGVNYTLFKSGITEETLSRLEIDASYELSLEDGQLKVKLVPQKLAWTGEGEDEKWSTLNNWNGTRPPASFDSIVFDGEGDETAYDLADGLLLAKVDVDSGAWTTKVDNACFANVPVQVKTGALFALTGARGRTNPFSTAKDANAIAGVLDLGGATQTFAGALADGNGIFRDGGEIRNVALTIDPVGWFRLHNVSFTIGQGANVSVKRYTDSKGQLNLYNSYLKIDGGSLTVLNERNVSNAGAYIGNDGDATIEILNGGKFSHPNKRVILGYGGDGKGAGSLVGDHATVDLEEQTLNLGNRNGSASRLVLTNSTLTCSAITLGFEGTPGKQTVELVNTTVKFNQFNQEKEPAAGSSITFDGATIVDNHGATALLQVLGIPYTIAEGGLTVKVANKDADDDYVSFPGTFNGEGDFILVAAGKTPRAVKFTNEEEKGFTGNLVVSNGVTVVAGDKTFKGGLYACEGSTLNVATSVFDGNVTIEEGVKFAGLDAEQDYEKPITLLQTKGTITSPLLEGKNPNTKNRYFVRSRLGVNVLCYGRKQGTIITIR